MNHDLTRDEWLAVTLVVAQLLDDCLIRIYPEEFTAEQRESAYRRFFDAGGTIARISMMADKLRQTASGQKGAGNEQRTDLFVMRLFAST